MIMWIEEMPDLLSLVVAVSNLLKVILTIVRNMWYLTQILGSIAQSNSLIPLILKDLEEESHSKRKPITNHMEILKLFTLLNWIAKQLNRSVTTLNQPSSKFKVK
jgi:hypothetical protein